MRMRRIPMLVMACALATSASVHAAEPGASASSLIDTANYRGLAADHRAHRVGDLVTIQVLEATRARSQAATEAGSDLDLSVGLSAPSTQYEASLGMSGGNAAGAQTTRLGELRTQVSARVIDVAPNGVLKISGEQVLLVNGEEQRIRITGSVRPEDIDRSNAVWSHRLADAQIELSGVGVVSESQRQSILYRVFKWLRIL
jgi:flagellar L-ring protein precursor FlgH